ncbi:unnamed protein product [Microthlaspi erraticum]|uniref:DUF4219 domain-containing protein n=1 Tax=Microthlaspi erraticum TaxID=1685480 RepID=A0A6D2IDG3_9BRAS|nr:unnamed protein product [Microthlaspi erraticum]
MSNEIVAYSRTLTGRARGRVLGVPKKCWGGELIVERISKSDQSLYCRYNRCVKAAAKGLINDNHTFKWVDDWSMMQKYCVFVMKDLKMITFYDLGDMAGEDGEFSVAVEKPKEGGGTSSIMYPLLNSTNYTVWALRMKIALKVHKVWVVIETDTVPLNIEKNNMAMALLFQSTPEALTLQDGELDTTRKVWEAIKAKQCGS